MPRGDLLYPTMWQEGSQNQDLLETLESWLSSGLVSEEQYRRGLNYLDPEGTYFCIMGCGERVMYKRDGLCSPCHSKVVKERRKRAQRRESISLEVREAA